MTDLQKTNSIMRRWALIFKALANINRLKIIKMLSTSKPLAVSEISRELEISLKATSKHLIILTGLDVLQNRGKNGHVFYTLNEDMPKDIRKIVHSFV